MTKLIKLVVLFLFFLTSSLSVQAKEEPDPFVDFDEEDQKKIEEVQGMVESHNFFEFERDADTETFIYSESDKIVGLLVSIGIFLKVFDRDQIFEIFGI